MKFGFHCFVINQLLCHGPTFYSLFSWFYCHLFCTNVETVLCLFLINNLRLFIVGPAFVGFVGGISGCVPFLWHHKFLQHLILGVVAEHLLIKPRDCCGFLLFSSSNKLIMHSSWIQVLFSETLDVLNSLQLKNEVLWKHCKFSPNKSTWEHLLLPAHGWGAQCRVSLNKTLHVQRADHYINYSSLGIAFAYVLKCQILSSWGCPNWIPHGGKLRASREVESKSV